MLADSRQASLGPVGAGGRVQDHRDQQVAPSAVPILVLAVPLEVDAQQLGDRGGLVDAVAVGGIDQVERVEAGRLAVDHAHGIENEHFLAERFLAVAAGDGGVLALGIDHDRRPRMGEQRRRWPAPSNRIGSMR